MAYAEGALAEPDGVSVDQNRLALNLICKR